jgi:hypothetical protein
MKKMLIAAALLSTGLAFAGSASAYMVGITDVGGADSLYNSTVNLSGEEDELEWVQGLLGSNYVYSKIDNNTGWVATDAAGVVAYDLGLGDDDYFLIKAGGNGTVTFLFENLASTAWAVVDLNYLKQQFGLQGNVNVSKISHWGPVSAVPLPGAAWLFGSALLGFMAVANRRRV